MFWPKKNVKLKVRWGQVGIFLPMFAGEVGGGGRV
jgi:hypothetical protein